MGTAGERLAAFASTLEWENLPPALRAQLKLHVLDTIGVMFAGLDTPEGRAAQAAAARWGSGDEATAVGLDGRLPAPSAAFLNALTRGNVTLAAFVDSGGDPEIAALMERIAVLHDEELEKSYPAK